MATWSVAGSRLATMGGAACKHEESKTQSRTSPCEGKVCPFLFFVLVPSPLPLSLLLAHIPYTFAICSETLASFFSLLAPLQHPPNKPAPAPSLYVIAME